MVNAKRRTGGRAATTLQRVVEVEQKFEAPAGFVLPDLTGLPGVDEVGEPHEHALDATYFDTADLRLAAHRTTLRRRTGGEDAGWHLKTPRTDGARTEHREPLGRGARTVPPSLRALVQAHVRGAELEPVVRLRTRRTVTKLLAPGGRVLAEVAQDRVNAAAPTRGGSGTDVQVWHELEVELVEGDAALLDAVGARLLAAGAAASSSASKLTRALGDRAPAVTATARPVPARAGRGGGPRSRAGEVVLAHLAEHVGRLVAQDPLVRADAPDAVHQMRVATRRLRSALATYRPLFDRGVTDPVRGELQWLGEVLGAARDAEVTRDRLRAAVEAEPDDLVLGPVVRRVVDTMGARYRTAHDAAVAELDGARYFALLDALDRLVAEPPLTDAARGKARDVLPRLVRRSYRDLARLVAAFDELDPVAGAARRDELLHDVRKAAKRARYGAESLAPAFGKDAVRFARAMAAVQEVLGDHQDGVVLREELRSLAVQAHLDGENGFTFGRLHGLEQARAATTDERFARAWEAATGKHLLRWLG